jgi:hypothetical protein
VTRGMGSCWLVVALAGCHGDNSSPDTADAAYQDATCGCEGQAGCAVWSNVFISFYGFNDNSCTTENQHGCNDIAYPAPQSTAGMYGTLYPNAGNITHTQATEGAGTYNDPITAASSADTQPQDPTAQDPRHQFEASGGATLSPGTLIYNPGVQKYFIMEDSCIECGDEYACIISPEDTDDGSVPAGCMPGTNLHVDFWMGPSFASDASDLDNCEDLSTTGSDWVGEGGDIIVNPPSDLPVASEKLYVGSGTGGGCWTTNQRIATLCK